LPIAYRIDATPRSVRFKICKICIMLVALLITRPSIREWIRDARRNGDADVFSCERGSHPFAQKRRKCQRGDA